MENQIVTLEIVVNDLNKAVKVAEQYNVEFEPITVGEAFAKLAIIRGTSDALIDFVDEFFLNSKIRPYYINEILTK